MWSSNIILMGAGEQVAGSRGAGSNKEQIKKKKIEINQKINHRLKIRQG